MDVRKATATVDAMADSATGITYARDAENPAVCVVDGYGITVTTSSGRLLISDGVGRHRRGRMYSRSTHGLARLVIIATTGSVTIDALRWLEGAGIGLVVLDPSTGRVVTASTRTANDDARLRRAQALAPGTLTGLVIARYLTRVKLAGQADIASTELDSPGIADTIAHLAVVVADSASIEEVRQLEATAANLYWSAWGSVEVNFVKKDAPRVPDNWRRFEGRRSAVSPGSARNASDPVNACLNYLYRLVEAEGHLATLAVGLDPGLGVFHADMKGRASFVLDLIEAARPLAERHLLRLLSQPLRWRDFDEHARGVVRVLPPLTHRLAEAMPAFGSALAPVVEHVAQLLASASPYDVANPSVLTKEKHRAAARRRLDTVGNRVLPLGPGTVGLAPRTKRRQKPEPSMEAALPLPICRGCGVVVEPESDRRRARGAYCPKCLARRRREVGAALPAASAVHSAEFTGSTGIRPTHTPSAQKRRQETNARRRAEQAAWESAHGDSDPEWFQLVVLPGLAGFTLGAIATATGMSTSAASKVRGGRRVPHPRHWESLASLVGINAQDQP